MLSRSEAAALQPKVVAEFRARTGLRIGSIGIVRQGDRGYGYDIVLYARPDGDLPQNVAGAPVSYRVFVERPEAAQGGRGR
jgi:hypothetical protein